MKRKSNPMTEQDAVFHIMSILKQKGLFNKLRCQITTLLHEQRRNPYSDYALSKGTLKGNRSQYGVIPYIREKGKVIYEQYDLNYWLSSTLIPILSRAAE